MNICPTCYTDLDDQIDRGKTTGLWRFIFPCECGSILIWERRRLRLVQDSEKQPVF